MNKLVVLLLTVFFFLIIPIPKANVLQTTKIEGKIPEQEFIKYQDIKYSTFIGGLNLDCGIAIDVDNNQNAFITCTTSSINYPVINLYDKLYNLFGDVFVTKFSPSNHSLIREVKGGFSLSVIYNSCIDPLNWSINVYGMPLFGGKNNGTIPP